MNDLSTSFENVREVEPAEVDLAELAGKGHIFRSRILDKCASIESWTIAILNDAAASSGEVSKGKHPHLFGQKIEAVRKIAESEASILESPDKVIGLLDRLKPYAHLRSALAHSLLGVAAGPAGEPLFIFEIVCETARHTWERRLVFTTTEMRAALADMAAIGTALSHQKMAT